MAVLCVCVTAGVRRELEPLETGDLVVVIQLQYEPQSKASAAIGNARQIYPCPAFEALSST